MNEIRNQAKHRPLMIGCSGGGGHNTAIAGIYKDKSQNADYEFIDHNPASYDEMCEKHAEHKARLDIAMGLSLLHERMFSGLFRWIGDRILGLPVIPKRELLSGEIDTLKQANQPSKPRKYVDMLLDIYPAGYESAAIWNLLQRADETKMLKRLVSLQRFSDRSNYEVVKASILKMLTEAHQNDKPYTEIISSQAMSLPALCDAVREYNEGLGKENPIIIHQYLTDLPTKGAVHYFNALNLLTKEQQQVMALYGRGLTEDVVQKFLAHNHFNKTEDIPADNNPMIRQGFKEKEKSLHEKWDKDCTVSYYKDDNQEEKEQRAIAANDKVASIMLGSQASSDTVKYVKSLIDEDYDHIFVFLGNKPEISKGIDELIAQYPLDRQEEIKNKIIRLAKQSDYEMMPIMTRSNTIFTRGGGLSCMEQMAMPHNPQQSILIHHADQKSKNPSSGISWEDENVNELTQFLTDINVHAKKTMPCRANEDIQEGWAYAYLKKFGYSVAQIKIDTVSRVKLIMKRLSTNVFKANVQNIIQSIEKIKAVSRLAACGGAHLFQNEILEQVINNADDFNKVSAIASRSIAYLYAVSCLDNDKKPKYKLRNAERALFLTEQLYKNIDALKMKIDVKKVKAELFSKIIELDEMDKIYDEIRKNLTSSLRQAFLLDFLKYRFELLKKGDEQKLVEGIKDIILSTYFETGFLSGEKVETKNGKTHTNLVPREMKVIMDKINEMEERGASANDILKEVQGILNAKTKNKSARQEYSIFKENIDQCLELDKNTTTPSAKN
jgi:hypothetical protein